MSGPGERYVLGPQPPGERQWRPEEIAALPEGYGTRELFLTARDPHWLYATWDLSHEQQQQYNKVSADGHLILRVYRGQISEHSPSEIHVHPESRGWFVHVPHADAKYIAELGYRGRDHQWHTVSMSAATITPPETLSPESDVQFATLPMGVTLEDVLSVMETAVGECVPIAEAIQQLRAEGHAELPAVPALTPQPGAPAPTRSGPAAAPLISPAPSAALLPAEPRETEAPAIAPQASLPEPTRPPPPSSAISIPSGPAPISHFTEPAASPAESVSAFVEEGPFTRPELVQVWTDAPPVPSHIESAPPEATSYRPARPRLLPRPMHLSKWTPAQERALAEVLRLDEHRRVWMGSIEITELVRRHLARSVTSPGLDQMDQVTPEGVAISEPFPSPAGIFSPTVVGEKGKGFWFNINAEIVIYGATDPDAEVRMAGRKIKLRPDGTFSFRFALPDGNYQLPVVAAAAEGDDARSATLRFQRRTEYHGEVEAHPPDPALKPPKSESLP